MVSTPTQILKQFWGYENFHPEQEKVIHHALQKKDTIDNFSGINNYLNFADLPFKY